MWEEATTSLEKAAPAHDSRKLYQILKETTGKKAAESEVVKLPEPTWITLMISNSILILNMLKRC